MICAETGIRGRECWCDRCAKMREEAAAIRLRKAKVMLAEPQNEQEILLLDKHLREIVRALA